MKCKFMLLVGATAMALSLTACGDDDEDTDNTNTNDNGNNTEPVSAAERFAGKYRDDLSIHPGCVPRTEYTGINAEPFSLANDATVPSGSPASITGYTCAAKEYDQPSEDTTLPIVILVHGNSSGVTTYEEFTLGAIVGMELTSSTGVTFTADATAREQLASKLIAAGHRVIGFDARVDLVATEEGWNMDQATGNAFLNIDHGWAVPLLQSLVNAVMTNNPSREVSLVGHSLGATVVRDTLRRMYINSRDNVAGAVNPFPQLADVILLSGANKGVAAGTALCAAKPTQMAGTVTCEMGDRESFTPTYFTRPNN
ncbi:MAG: alpha/beta hydrolase, partial [Myxococcota bacterium]